MDNQDKITDNHIKLLYEISELNHKWYSLYWDNPPSYDIFLELNHQTLMFHIDDNSTEESITTLLNKVQNNFEILISEYEE